MNNTDLKIVIVGATNSGKSTIAEEISRYLHLIGFETNLVDDNTPLEIFQVDRLKALKERGIKIEIQTAQANV